jgi:hypothetical protein
LAEERGFRATGDRAPAWRSRRGREPAEAPGTKTGPRAVGLSAGAVDGEKQEGATAADMEEAMRGAGGGETDKEKRQ